MDEDEDNEDNVVTAIVEGEATTESGDSDGSIVVQASVVLARNNKKSTASSNAMRAPKVHGNNSQSKRKSRNPAPACASATASSNKTPFP